MNIPKEILRAAAEPYWAPAEAAKKGRLPVAILPGYFPAELLAAAGARPFRIWGGRAATVNADAELQAYICSMAKSVLEDILDGTLDFAAAFVVPSVCDTMQNLSDVIAARGKKVFCFRLPRSSFRPEAEAWLVKEAARFSAWIATVTGRPVEAEALAMEADRANAVRSSVLELYGLRRACPPAFAGSLFYDMTMASFSLDASAFAAAISCCATDGNKVLPSGQRDPAATDFKCLHPSPGGGRRVIVSGTAPIPAGFTQAFCDAGLDIVDDDFMAGRRLFSKPILHALEPAALFESFLGGAPCPSNTFGHDRRPAYLVDLAKQAGAKGVVFWQTKACENEAFDYPWVDAALKEKGLKTLLCETEQNGGAATRRLRGDVLMPVKLRAQDDLKTLMAAYYLESKNASFNNKKVAWVSSGAPVEFLYALGYIPIYPENYAAMCGAAKMSPDLIAEAEAAGYVSDLCSYARTDIGADIVQGDPVMGLPHPDLIVAGTNICTTIIKWFQQIAYRKKVPFVALEMPYLTAGFGGLTTAFDNPTRRSFVVEMVPEDEINNAVSLNSALMTGSRVVGPALAGLLITTVGFGWAFLADGLSYTAVLVGLSLMRSAELRPAQLTPRGKGQVREGLRYAWSITELRVPLLMMAIVGTLTFNFQTVFPLFVTRDLHGSPVTFTLLMSVVSLGSLVGALSAARRDEITVHMVSVTAIAFGVAMGLIALSPNQAVAFVVGLLVGASSISFMTASTAIVQIRSDPMMRGRVLALQAMVFLGSTPIGGPIVGAIAQRFGARYSIGIGAVAAVAAGAYGLVGIRRRHQPAAPELVSV